MLEFIKNRLAKVKNYTAGFFIFLVLVATAPALTFSRTGTRPLEAPSQAVQNLGQGDFEARVSIKSKDEFGDMGQVVNRVGPQLKEDYKMRRSLEVAMAVQQNLLPETPPKLPGLDIFGMTLFSDETGGDYFDYLCIDKENKNKLCVMAGDVVGHGNPSALLMATVRGFLRMRVTMPGTLGDIVTDVNREFVMDAEDSAQLMTLFLARIDRDENRINWVRAGHDPAILYDPDTDSFSSLNDGNGMPLGISQVRFTRLHPVTSNPSKSFSLAPTVSGKRVTLKENCSAKKDCNRLYIPIPENPPGRWCCLSWMQWKSFAAGKSWKMILPW